MLQAAVERDGSEAHRAYLLSALLGKYGIDVLAAMCQSSRRSVSNAEELQPHTSAAPNVVVIVVRNGHDGESRRCMYSCAVLAC